MGASARVRETLERIHREDFLPIEQHRFAGQDRALPIGHGQTNSQPTTVRNLLTLLEVEPGHRVLDVGSGSGWTSALLGTLVGPSGEVHGVELVPELVHWSRENLTAYPMPWVRIYQAGSGVLGLPDLAPFDRILVSADAESLPESLVEQLCEDGLMVIPVASRMTTVRRTSKGPDVAHHGAYAFVPLVQPG